MTVQAMVMPCIPGSRVLKKLRRKLLMISIVNLVLSSQHIYKDGTTPGI